MSRFNAGRTPYLLLFLVACESDKGITVHRAPPVVALTAPADGQAFDVGDAVEFSAVVDDDHDAAETLTVTWTSDRDGVLNTDPADADGDARFATAALSVGTHVVTVQAVDSDAESAEDYVTITIEAVDVDPTITVRSPNAADYGVEGVAFTFEALVHDEQDEATALTTWFSSDLDGTFCEPVPDADGLATCDAALSPGDHAITMGVVDTAGNEATAEATFTVVARSAWDGDADGYTEDRGDCDDADPSVHPGATEYANGADDDCDGTVDEGTTNVDDDGDGFTEGDGDCDDGDPDAWPGALEVCNGIDDDCDRAIDDGTSCVDDDGDGYSEAEGDCDDASADTWPGAGEIADAADNDCDGTLDEGTSDYDDDGDCACETGPCAGSSDAGCTSPVDGDCDDADAEIGPEADEWCNEVDDDCDGTADEDALDEATFYADLDGDLYGDPADTALGCDAPTGYVANALDCDDSDADVSPAGSEVCDGDDDDCDGTVDEAFATDAPTWYADTDGDGYGAAGVTTRGCTAPAGYVADHTDCSDASAAINPAASETCNSTDDDCDGTVDENSATDAATWYRDADGDGYGTPSTTAVSCTLPGGYSAVSTDCDDTLATVSPVATEACNGADDDCDGATDEGVTTLYYLDADGDGYGSSATYLESCTALSGYVADASDCDDSDPALNPDTAWYRDADGDGFGAAGVVTHACAQPSGYVSDDTDCTDTSSSVHPGASETCNSTDDDCDGTIDENSATDAATWYRDADGDGYGTAASTSVSCTRPTGYAGVSTDCDDTAAAVSPAATETCNATDDDCDGSTDEGVTTTYYRDADGDGYGTASTYTAGCSAPSGYVTNASDCDDTSATTSPDTTWYRDADGDGYGSASVTTHACTQPSGYVSDSTDCGDTSSTVHPGASETCNSTDDDCDGTVDENSATDATTWYRDADGDSYGTSSTTSVSCTQPTGYVATSTDCNDSSAVVSPAAVETCNSTDDDCDGSTDEGVTTTYYRDADGDGYGLSTSTTTGCSLPSGYATVSGDCNDSNASRNPDTVWYRDADGDGYGTSSTTRTQCVQPTGYVSTATDCNDSSSSAYPGATETCDSYDNDCDGSTDEINASGCTAYYYDSDGDTYGSASVASRCYCSPTGSYTSTNNDDCYDSNADAYPGATTYHTANRGDGSWDYNCDGTASKRYTSIFDCTGAVYVCVDSTDGWTSSAPACGSSASWRTGCDADLTSCTWDSSTTRTQSCR